jgi:hypothetical protein
MATRADRQVEAGQRQQNLGPRARSRGRAREHRWQRATREQRPSALEPTMDIAGSQKTVVADLRVAARQHMQEEPSQELGRSEGDLAALLGSKANAIGSGEVDTRVGDTDPVCVAAEVPDHVLDPCGGEKVARASCGGAYRISHRDSLVTVNEKPAMVPGHV